MTTTRGKGARGRGRGALGAVLAVGLALGACSEPVEVTPRRLALYQGEWTGPNVTLSIDQRRFEYRKTGGMLNFAYLKGSFRGLRGNDIIYGAGRGNSRLRVDVPPHRVGNVWKMTVEGVELQRR